MTIDYKNLVIEELNYNSYLKIPDLLQLQNQISKPPHHDEMFFIIIHQSAELWFKEMLHETEMLVSAFREGVVSRAIKIFKRITAIMNLQVQQIRLLSTLTPVEFAGFREYLRPASGFQSAQFRIMEFSFGVRNSFFLQFFEKIPAVSAKLKHIMTQPSVYDEYLLMLKKRGYPVPEGLLTRDFSAVWTINEELVNTFKDMYENPKDDTYHLVLLMETMLDLDEAFILWRKTHAVMVDRTIGQRQGTGGSAGFEFLRSRENLKTFPELWEVRNVIGGSY